MNQKNSKRLLFIFLVGIVVSACFAEDRKASGLGSGPEIKTGLEIFVSPNGNDSGAGTRQSPFRTPARARDAIRAIKKEGSFPQGGVTVWIGGGEYPASSSLELTGEDSGTQDRPVIYRSYPDEKARLIGGVPVDSTQWKPINAAARKRVHPRVNPDNLRELDVKKLGFEHVGKFADSDRFSTEWYIIDLFANDRRQPISKWPNPNENIRGVNDPGWTTCNGSKDNFTFYYGQGGVPQDKDLTNELDKDGTNRSRRWKASLEAGHDLWLKGCWRTPWEPWTMRIKEINTEQEWIRFYMEPSGGMGSKYTPNASEKPLWRVGSGKEKWLAINLLDEIDMPGEWALDIQDQKLYYWPPSAIETLKIMVSDRAQPLIRLKNVHHVQIIGLNLEGGLGNGIEMTDCADNLIAGCTIANSGNTGIRDVRGMRNRIQSNDIYETGGWGIELSRVGDRAKLIDSGIQIINNHIHHIGRLAFKEGIRMDTCVGVRVAHNLIHDIPKGGIRNDMMNNCLFEYNEVHNNALGESDTGTFYGYGGWSTYGNVYRYNFTHHTNRSNGFYCDDGDSGDVFYNNIVQGSITALKFGGGHDNLAHNNLLVENQNQEIDDRGISRNYRIGTNYEKQLREMKPQEEPWLSYGKKLTAEFQLKTRLWSDVLNPDWHPEWPNGSTMVDNAAVACGPFNKPKNGDVQVSGNLIIKTIQEAGFYDYKNMDLRTDNSKILEKFPRLNEVFPMIGLQKDEYRLYVPTRAQTGGLEDRGMAGDPWNEDQFLPRTGK
jgi:parallel beta-helix repeat protein